MCAVPPFTRLAACRRFGDPGRETNDKSALSGLGSLSPSSSFEKLELAKLDLNALNTTMKDRCNRTRLHVLLKNAESEGNAESEADWHPLLCFTLVQLTYALSGTNLRSSIIAPPNLDDAEGIVNGFTEDQLEEWKDGVRSGLTKDDWVALITHRTYISELLVGSLDRLIATTGTIRNRKVT